MGTLQHIQHQISAVNDLVLINNDRATCYENALAVTKDPALQTLFKKHLDQSLQNSGELKGLVLQFGGDPAAGTTLVGKFYRTWMDLKSKITGTDAASVLETCEHEEITAEKAYRDALDDKELIWQDKQVVTLLNRHLKGLTAAREKISALRPVKI